MKWWDFCHEMVGSDAMILVFWMLSFKPVFFTLFFHFHQEALGVVTYIAWTAELQGLRFKLGLIKCMYIFPLISQKECGGMNSNNNIQHIQNTNFISVSCTVLSHVQLFTVPWTVAHQLLCLWNFPGKNTGMGCHFLLKGIFPTQGFNPSLASPALGSRFLTTSIHVLVLGRVCMPDFSWT